MAENAAQAWYVVHTYSGYENKVKSNLEKAVENSGVMREMISEIMIPVEETVEIKNGKRKIVPRKILPGYVFVRMIMTNESWYFVRNTRGVTGFVGSGSGLGFGSGSGSGSGFNASPLSDADVANILTTAQQASIDIAIGDEVRMLSGSLANYTGKVQKIDSVRQKLGVMVSMFGRDTVVELDYDQVERV